MARSKRKGLHKSAWEDEYSDNDDDDDMYDGPSANNVLHARAANTAPPPPPPPPPLAFPPEYLPLLRVIDRCEGPKGGVVRFDRIDSELGANHSDVLTSFTSTKAYCESAREAGMPIEIVYDKGRRFIETIRIKLTPVLYNTIALPPGSVAASSEDETAHIMHGGRDLTLEVVKALLQVSVKHGQRTNARDVETQLRYVAVGLRWQEFDLLPEIVQHLQEKCKMSVQWNSADETIVVLEPDEKMKSDLLRKTITLFFKEEAKMHAATASLLRYIDNRAPEVYLATHSVQCAEIVGQAHKLGVPVVISPEGYDVMWIGSIQDWQNY